MGPHNQNLFLYTPTDFWISIIPNHPSPKLKGMGNLQPHSKNQNNLNTYNLWLICGAGVSGASTTNTPRTTIGALKLARLVILALNLDFIKSSCVPLWQQQTTLKL